MKLEFYFDLETTGNVWKCLDLVKSYLFRIYYWCRIGYVSVFLTYCVYMITVFHENFMCIHLPHFDSSVETPCSFFAKWPTGRPFVVHVPVSSITAYLKYGLRPLVC